LKAAGVQLLERADDGRPAAELLAFRTASPEVLRLVEELGRGGLVRVVAMALAGRSLDGPMSWRLLEAGASDVVAWEDDHAATTIADRLERWRQIDELVASPAVEGSLVGAGPGWIVLLREIVEVARFTDASVLITGESGTGKELVARLIHDLDPRPDKRELVIVDCTTVVPTLSGSEFFGHEKGAFTGASASRDGAFALADGGTLFLDEVGERPGSLQAELLRVIQEGMYKRVGSNTWRMTGFRLVCATNRDLLVEQEAGRFRSDLFYRIAEWQFHLPPLRERTADIPLLTRTFLRRTHPSGGGPAIDGAVLRLIAERDYPGNIRDLRQFIQRIAKRHVGDGPITVGDVPPRERIAREPQLAANWAVGPGVAPDVDVDLLDRAVRAAIDRGASLAEIKRRAADAAIRAVLAEEPTIARAAERLGVTTRALQLRQAADREEHPIPRPGVSRADRDGLEPDRSDPDRSASAPRR
jgi:transcriptional regulator with GAF, ATPase, and Fis domain